MTRTVMGEKAIVTARAHSARATAVERVLIESLSVQYDSDQYPDRTVRDEKYIEAARSVLDRYPDDLEAGFMYCGRRDDSRRVETVSLVLRFRW